MPAPVEWPTRPVFISSTFKDMHAERDWLRNRVFPQLEEELKKRHHHLETIDLRLGVETVEEASEEARELKVLKVCLDEIERSRPFFIVLLGDRYGWVPPDERMEQAAREAGFTTKVSGKSVTALEIEFGIVKKDPAQRHRSFFYFRDPLPYAEMPDEKRAQYSDEYAPHLGERAGYGKLQALKAALQTDAELKDRIRPYCVEWDRDGQAVTGLQAFGRMVFNDLWAELQEETQAYLERAPASWQEAEQRALAEFVEDRGRLVIGRDQVIGGLLDLAHSPARENARWGACVIGGSGSGKSALFAALYKRLSADESIVLLAHAAGITPRAGQVDAMLRRWVGELAQVLGIATPPDDDAPADKVEKTFHEYLGRASTQRRVVVFIDALNQFEASTRARYLTWLPKLWPPNARLIATAIPGTESEALDERAGMELEDLPPLAEEDARQVLAAVCKRYHRELFHRDIVDAVLARQCDDRTAAAGNPLWLNLAVEELNLLDADDFARAERDYAGLRADHRLHQLVLDTAQRLPPDVEGLYGWLLDRTEQVYGAHWAKAFASVTAVSRFGWRESDLRVLVPAVARLFYSDQACDDWDDLTFADLRRGFRAHLRQRGAQAQWDFFHLQMRQAIEHRNLRDTNRVRQIHSAMANHLEALDRDDPLRQTELMVHLVGADDWSRVARSYGGDLNSAEEAGATQALAHYVVTEGEKHPDSGAKHVVSLLNQEDLTDHHIGRICHRFFELSAVLDDDASLATRLSLMRGAEEALEGLVRRDPSNPNWQRDLSGSEYDIGGLLAAQGDHASALVAYRTALDRTRRLVKRNPRDAQLRRVLMGIYRALSLLHWKHGSPQLALAALEPQISWIQRLFEQDPTSSTLQEELVSNLEYLAPILSELGSSARAVASYRAALAIAEDLAKRDPDNVDNQRRLSIIHNHIGEVLVDQGDIASALASYETSLHVMRRLTERDPGNTLAQIDLSTTHRKMGDALKASGDNGGALAAYRVALGIVRQCALRQPENVEWRHEEAANELQIGKLLAETDGMVAALAAYRNALPTLQSLSRLDPGNVRLQHDLSTAHTGIGDLLRLGSDNMGALKAYEEALAIDKQLVEQSRGATSTQRHLSIDHERIGIVLAFLGDRAGALAAQRAALRIRKQLVEKDPLNAVWQSDVSNSQENLGNLLEAEGNEADALAAYRAALSIRQQLLERAPRDIALNRGLASNYEAIGDLLAKQGNSPEALAAYQARLEIDKRLLEQEPNSAQLRRGLSVSENKVGDMLRQQGDNRGALAAYERALAIRICLVEEDPQNPQWLNDLVSSNHKLAVASHAVGDPTSAHSYVRRCREVLGDMKLKGIALEPQWTELLELIDRFQMGGASPSEVILPAGTAGVSRPHPGADPDRATRLNREFQHALAVWQALPFWKRMITKKPEPPSGI